jgi:hypothetical protein
VTAVAVFAHAPSAADLLTARLARGWRPTASALKGGDRVLGYSACAVTGEHRAASDAPEATGESTT